MESSVFPTVLPTYNRADVAFVRGDGLRHDVHWIRYGRADVLRNAETSERTGEPDAHRTRTFLR